MMPTTMSGGEQRASKTTSSIEPRMKIASSEVMVMRDVLGQRGVELVDRGRARRRKCRARSTSPGGRCRGRCRSCRSCGATCLRSAGPKTTSATSPTRVGRVDLDRRDLLGRLGARVGADEQRLVLVGDLAGRRVERDAAERRGQIVDGEAARGERVGIDDDADQRLAVAAELRRRRRPRRRRGGRRSGR